MLGPPAQAMRCGRCGRTMAVAHYTKFAQRVAAATLRAAAGLPPGQRPPLEALLRAADAKPLRTCDPRQVCTRTPVGHVEPCLCSPWVFSIACACMWAAGQAC